MKRQKHRTGVACKCGQSLRPLYAFKSDKIERVIKKLMKKENGRVKEDEKV